MIELLFSGYFSVGVGNRGDRGGMGGGRLGERRKDCLEKKLVDGWGGTRWKVLEVYLLDV